MKKTIKKVNNGGLGDEMSYKTVEMSENKVYGV